MGAESPYPYLTEYDWRKLLALGVVFHATRRRLAEWHEHILAEDALQIALRELHLAADASALHATSDDEAVELTNERWIAVLQRLAGEVSEPVRVLITDLASLVGEATSADPYAALFQMIANAVGPYYKTYWSQPSFSIAKMTTHPRPYPPLDPYPVSAASDESPPLVELHINPDLFGPAGYAALPSLLFHECVCHVCAQGNLDGDVNESIFAEGLMDWIAVFLLGQWIGELDPELASAAIKHGEAHGQLLRRAVTSPGAARRFGHNAADDLRRWWQRECEVDYLGAHMQTTLFGLDKNMSQEDLSAKDDCVTKLRLQPLPQATAEMLKGRLRGNES